MKNFDKKLGTWGKRSLWFVVGSVIVACAVVHIAVAVRLHGQMMQAVEQIDRVIENVELSTWGRKLHVGAPCSILATQLRVLAASSPSVRSVNVADGERLYCSSIYGEMDEVVSFDEYSGDSLLLLPGNIVTPNQALVVLRKMIGRFSVLIGIEINPLHDILARGEHLQLVIGDVRLDAEGDVNHSIEVDDVVSWGMSSTRYAYEVRTKLSVSEYWSFLQDIFQSFWGCALIFVSLLLGYMGVYYRRVFAPIRAIRLALANGEFVPYLQPVVGGQGEGVIGCEVLMRWQHPEKGIIPPNRFISLAESSGLIVPMTRSLMRQVQELYVPVVEELPVGFHFAFNIAASHCRDLSLLDDCKAFLAGFAGHPVSLILELTERELIVADDMTIQLFAELRSLGVSIAIDDFGTGHSSFSYLQQFRVDVLKIDQRFVKQLGFDELSEHIVDNMIDLARRADLKLVAEGVESVAQWEYLSSRGVNSLQGYFFGKPVPAASFYL